MDYEGMTVTLHSEQNRGDYVIRRLEVMNDRAQMTMQGYIVHIRVDINRL